MFSRSLLIAPALLAAAFATPVSAAAPSGSVAAPQLIQVSASADHGGSHVRNHDRRSARSAHRSHRRADRYSRSRHRDGHHDRSDLRAKKHLFGSILGHDRGVYRDRHGYDDYRYRGKRSRHYGSSRHSFGHGKRFRSSRGFRNRSHRRH